MQETRSNEYTTHGNNEINFLELFNVLIKGKWIIVSMTTFASIIGVVYSLNLPNIYESKAILVPENMSSAAGSLSGYASLAGAVGINIPSPGKEGNYVKALKKIKTLSFFENNILPYIFLPDLMAVDAWNYETNTIVYDEKLYSHKTNTWNRIASYPYQQNPSAQEAFEQFMFHFTLIQDPKNEFVEVKIKHQSPFVAKQWTELIIEKINTYYRDKDKAQSERAVSYLNKQIVMTSLSEVKQVIATLLQEETQKLTLIEAKQYYVLEIVDPPAVMEKKSDPKRAIICIISALLGGILSIFIVLIKQYGFKQKIY